MSLIVDIIIVLIISSSILLGFKKGLTRSLFGIISFILSMVISFVLYIPISNFIIQNTNIDERIQSSISDIIEKKGTEEKVEEKKGTDLPQVINKYIEKGEKTAKDKALQTTSLYISQMSVRIITGIIVFIFSKSILIILKQFTKIFANLPIIKQCDRIGGFAYGTIKGFFIVYLALLVISLIYPTMQNNNIVQAVVNSNLGGRMFNNNILLLIFFK